MIGQKFSRLTVIGIGVPGPKNSTRYRCRCECGEERDLPKHKLTTGHTRSCGCLQREMVKARLKTHGDSSKKSTATEYTIWSKMIQRCGNENEPSYENYGGRGIRVCERWLSYENFLEDMGRRPSKKHSIDRIDNNGDYAPGNCRWASRGEQSRNTRRNVLISFQGRAMVAADWSRELGIPQPTIHWRMAQGWTVERVLSPDRYPKKSVEQRHGIVVEIA